LSRSVTSIEKVTPSIPLQRSAIDFVSAFRLLKTTERDAARRKAIGAKASFNSSDQEIAPESGSRERSAAARIKSLTPAADLFA
jgi:hypothetical protein